MPRPSMPLRRTGAVLLALAVLLAGCSTAPPVGQRPGVTVTETPPATPAQPGPTRADSLQIDVFIDRQTVTPLNKTFELRKGRSVVLVTRSDHDVTLLVTGPSLDRSVFIGRLTTITTTFVADQQGVITITSSDPQATIATLSVT